MGDWKVTTAATEAVISTAEAKAWLRVEHSDEDALIASIVAACTATAQNYLSQAFTTQTITEKFNSWLDSPDLQVLNLTVHPVQSVTSVQYVDSDGVTQTLDASQYTLNNFKKRATIHPAHDVTFPAVQTVINPITVTYVAGYGGASAVTEDIKMAVRLMVADMYENRTDSVKQLPSASKYILDRINYTFLI